jgi:hypothetical protein
MPRRRFTGVGLLLDGARRIQGTALFLQDFQTAIFAVINEPKS